jgi:Secretion system C-terminal sorting domain
MIHRLRVLSVLLLTGALGNTFAQDNWSKLPNYPDTVFMGSGYTATCGDSIFVDGMPGDLGGQMFTHLFSPDAGATWQTNLPPTPNFTGFPPYIQALPLNDLILVNTVANSVYQMGPNLTWTPYLTDDNGAFADLDNNNILYYSTYWDELRIGPPDGSAFVGTGIDFSFYSYLNVGNRIILGGEDGQIATMDNGDPSTFALSTMNPLPASLDRVFTILRQPDGDLFAQLYGPYDRLSRSTDNGATWNLVNITYNPIQNGNLSSLTMTTAGDLLLANTGDTQVWRSTDDGATATPWNTGIPTGTVLEVGLHHLMRLRNGTNLVGVRFLDYGGPPFLIAGNSGLFSTEGTNAVIDLRNDAVVSAYPVPCIDRLTLDLPQERATIELIDALGKIVHSSKTTGGTTVLDLSGTKPGCYTVLVRSNEHVHTARVVVE